MWPGFTSHGRPYVRRVLGPFWLERIAALHQMLDSFLSAGKDVCASAEAATARIVNAASQV